MLTQSHGDNWWNEKLEHARLQQAMEMGENSRLFSPISQNRNELTPLDRLPGDDLKLTMKKMQQGYGGKSQQSLMSQALQMKKAQAEDSEDDCNVDADIGEEYNMSAINRKEKPESFQEKQGKPLYEINKKPMVTQRQNVAANKVPPLAMTKLQDSIENNSFASSMRIRGLAINTPLSNTSFQTQRNKFSNPGSFQNPSSSANNTMLNPQDMSMSQSRIQNSSALNKPVQGLKSPLKDKRITPSPSYYNQYTT